jgi:hypothetical protein
MIRLGRRGIFIAHFALFSIAQATPPPSTQPTAAEKQAIVDEVTRKSRELDLKNAGNFMLIVSVNGSAEKLALRTEDLQTKVELELRRVGIPFNPTKLKDIRFLHVDLSTVGDDSDRVIGFSINVSLQEQVLTLRKGMTMATTWESSTFGTIGRTRSEELYATTIDHVQKFANAYLTSNPVQPNTSSE